MLKKADKRKRHEEKDTEFKVGIRAVTLDCVYRTVKRSKNKDHQINTDGMWLFLTFWYHLKRCRRTDSIWSHIQYTS